MAIRIGHTAKVDFVSVEGLPKGRVRPFRPGAGQTIDLDPDDWSVLDLPLGEDSSHAGTAEDLPLPDVSESEESAQSDGASTGAGASTFS